MNTSFLRVNMSHKYKMSELSNGKIIQERFQGAPWFANTHDARCRSNARLEVTLDGKNARWEITLEVPSQYGKAVTMIKQKNRNKDTSIHIQASRSSKNERNGLRHNSELRYCTVNVNPRASRSNSRSEVMNT